MFSKACTLAKNLIGSDLLSLPQIEKNFTTDNIPVRKKLQLYKMRETLILELTPSDATWCRRIKHQEIALEK